MNEIGARRFTNGPSETAPLDDSYYALARATFVAAPVVIVLAGAYLLTRSLPNSAAIAGLSVLTLWVVFGHLGFDARKRAMDVAGAAIGLLLLSPVLVIVAAAVAIDSGRPILFLQRRMGRNGAPFDIIKFRTMRLDAGSAWVQQDDDRITRIGRFLRRNSLDELPQLVNVLLGEMSLVGPRPEMESYARSFARSVPGYDLRHAVRPGITGYAQVCGRRDYDETEIGEIAGLDRFYLEHRSLVMDLALIYKTAYELSTHRSVGR